MSYKNHNNSYTLLAIVLWPLIISSFFLRKCYFSGHWIKAIKTLSDTRAVIP